MAGDTAEFPGLVKVTEESLESTLLDRETELLVYSVPAVSEEIVELKLSVRSDVPGVVVCTEEEPKLELVEESVRLSDDVPSEEGKSLEVVPRRFRLLLSLSSS